MTRTRPRPSKKSERLKIAAEVAAIVASSSTAIARVNDCMRKLRRFERNAVREDKRERVREVKATMRSPPKAGLPDCGARCRDGHPCRRKCLPWRPRCVMHGGLSTGPRTIAGKARLAASMAERWAAWRRGEGPKPGRRERLRDPQR